MTSQTDRTSLLRPLRPALLSVLALALAACQGARQGTEQYGIFRM